MSAWWPPAKTNHKELQYNTTQLCPGSKNKKGHIVKSEVCFVFFEQAEHKSMLLVCEALE